MGKGDRGDKKEEEEEKVWVGCCQAAEGEVWLDMVASHTPRSTLCFPLEKWGQEWVGEELLGNHV